MTFIKLNVRSILDDLDVKGYARVPRFFQESEALKNLRQEIRSNVASLVRQKLGQKPLEDNDSNLLALNQAGINAGAILNDTVNLSGSLFRLLYSIEIENLMRQLSGSSFLSFNNPRFRIQIPGRDSVSNLPWHQDSHYNPIETSKLSLVFWISLSEISHDMGPILIREGSHVLGRLQPEDYVRPNGAIIPTIGRDHITDNAFDEVSFETGSGDLLLFDMNLIHRSGNNLSSKTKMSAQVRCHAFECLE